MSKINLNLLTKLFRNINEEKEEAKHPVKPLKEDSAKEEITQKVETEKEKIETKPRKAVTFILAMTIPGTGKTKLKEEISKLLLYLYYSQCY